MPLKNKIIINLAIVIRMKIIKNIKGLELVILQRRKTGFPPTLRLRRTGRTGGNSQINVIARSEERATKQSPTFNISKEITSSPPMTDPRDDSNGCVFL